MSGLSGAGLGAFLLMGEDGIAPPTIQTCAHASIDLTHDVSVTIELTHMVSMSIEPTHRITAEIEVC